MLSFVRWFVRVWFLAMLVFLPACASSCSCESAPDVPKPRPLLACKSRNKPVTNAPPLNNRVIVPGSIPQSFGVDAVGNAVASLSLPAAPSRGPQPDLTLHYSSANDHDAGMGVGFSLRAGSAVTRCPKEMAIDGEIRAVKYDDEDHASLCLDGKRLVVTAQNGTTMEYRLFPDEQIKVIGHFDSASASHFDAFFPDGSRVRYGMTAATRPMAQTGVPRAWLAEEQSDTRGNTLSYEWCFAEDTDGGYTAEYALTGIRYGGFAGQEYQNAVAYVYDVRKDDVRTTYTRGMALQHSLQLKEIQSFGPDEQLAYRYEFAYEKSEATTRVRLASVQACAGTGECKLPTRFHYAKPETGFEEIPTSIAAPLSRLSSPMVADFTGDGLNDWLVPDTTAWSTPGNPITEWRLARNTGGAFDPETPAYLEEWPVVDNAEGPSDPWQLQPELGTVIDYDQNGLPDVLLHDVTGTRVNHIVLRTKMDGTFEEINTQIAQPFPFGPTPDGLRGSAASVHLADVTGDGVPDLIQCNDQGDTIDTALLPTWKVHAWRPGGFDPTAEYIEPLWGHYCGTEMHTVDSNNDGVVDLIAPGYLTLGTAPAQLTGTFDVFRRRTDGTWEIFDTGVPISGTGWRTLFMDINGDGLPDAITSGHADGRLRTFKNMGRGFDTYPEESLEWDGTPLPQDKYFHLAATGDFDHDGREDIFLPMVDAISPDIPRWIILRATGGKNGHTFESIDSGIPFQAQISDIVEPADPRMPRVADFTGDGAVDVALFLGDTLRIFKNRVIDPDVVVGISDGTNDHDPDEPGFVPNVSMTYAHLTDESKTNGQPASASSFYISKDDPANGCAYPRHCAVGPTRVVREYALNDGQGGQRRYGLRYRDGRYDRDTADFLGFGKRILTDLDTGETTIDFYDNVTKVKIGERDVYPFVGHIQRQWQWVPGLATQPKPDQVEMMFGNRTLEVVPTNNAKTYFTQPMKLRTRRMQGSFSGGGSLEAYVQLVETLENATMLRDSTVDVLDFDEYGNVLEVKTTTDGVDATTHITRTVKNDVNKWMLGLPDTQTECSTGSGMQQCRTIVRTTNEFGEVQTESTSSNEGINDTKLTVAYGRDKYGNVTRVAADDAFGNHREATTIYDDNGVFPTRQIDALGHVTIQKYDPVLGVLESETDPNGLTVEWAADGFARLELEKRPDGSQTTVKRTREKVDGVWRIKERTTTTGGGDDETIADSLGRTVLTFAHGPEPTANAPRIMQIVEYDRLNGAVARKSVRAAEGTPSNALKFDVYAYDALAREVKHTTPWNAVITTAYNGALIDVTDPSGKHTITQMDAASRLVTITDADNGITKYRYAPFDALYTVTDPGGAVTKWTRDAFGRTRQLDDPDRGTTTFVNSGFGDQLSSTDALGRVVTWTPDALGRPKTRTDKLGAQLLTTSWTWDTATNGIGRLHHLTSPDAVKTYSYTKRGQTDGMTLSVGGESFAAKVQYDNVGRPDVLHYPQPLGELPFGVKYDYDAHGFRIGVRDAATSDAYWELTEVDETGRYKREQFGNGVTTTRSYFHEKDALKSITTTKGASTIQQLSYDWDEQLNLKSRTDALQAQNKTERFRYDSLDRLTCTYFSPTVNPVAPCTTSYGYAANGNLTSKSDVGILSYSDAKHPHAVTNAPGKSYTYNAVGNQVTRPGGAVIAYMPFDLPKTITQGGNTVSFGYDGDEQRISKASPTSETLYFDELFEQVTTAGTKEYRYHVHSPERAVAIVTRGGSDPGTKYLHVDHLGSVESVTKDDGTVDEKRSYDAFGAKRNPKWGEAGGVIAAKTTKGFTGHEEDDEFGLVNMKGRLFDPRMARFTTPDPVIPDIFDGQSFNAFSYVWNNPLSFVDPSGFDPEEPPILPIEQRITTYADGSITVDLLYPPRDGQPQKTLPPLDASAAVGAVLASADMATTGVAGAAKAAKEGVSSFFEGLLLGSLSDNDSWSATAGSVIGGLIPGVGLVADVRDFGAAVAHVANGDDGAWLELGASIVGFIPGGDIAKAAVKGATKATKAAAKAAKAGANVAGDAGKVVKGSTAAAADGLSGAQKGAGKVNAPRGPPSPTTNAPKKRGGENAKAATGRQKHEEFKEKAKAKGWDTRHGQMKDPATGKELRPDAITRNGNPIELKPNTPSGRAAGKRQMKKYEAASNGKKGRVIYYDP